METIRRARRRKSYMHSVTVFLKKPEIYGSHSILRKRRYIAPWCGHCELRYRYWSKLIESHIPVLSIGTNDFQMIKAMYNYQKLKQTHFNVLIAFI